MAKAAVELDLRSFLIEQLENEAKLTERALERVPQGKNDWKPHPKSMPLGVLAHLVAIMPSWIGYIVDLEELDIKPKEGQGHEGPREFNSPQEMKQALLKTTAEARKKLSSVTEERLQGNWKLLEGGKLGMEGPRYQHIRDVFTHLAHHRGQLTVYLRLLDVPVPAIYGPSADDHRF